MKKTYLILCACLLALAACQSGKRNDKGERPVLTVTIEPIRYFTEAIAGPHFNVTSMVPKGSSPETYDPTPQQLVDLSQSAAYLRIGYIGFEQVWMERLLQNAPKLPVFDLSKGIELIYDYSHTAHAHTEQPSNFDEAEAHAPGVEPHLWNSAANARILAGNIRDALARLDPANSSEYAARHDSLCRRIDRCDSLLRTRLAQPGAQRAFLIYHPALSYFARDYGLHQIAIEEGGKEPSPARLKTLIDECNREGVRVIFVQPEFDRRNAELIARQTGARIAVLNPLAYDWEAELLRTGEELTFNEE